MSLSYEIRIRGRIEEHLARDLGLSVDVRPVESVLCGPVAGQEGLHEVLSQLQDMGLELIEVRQLPPGEG